MNQQEQQHSSNSSGQKLKREVAKRLLKKGAKVAAKALKTGVIAATKALFAFILSLSAPVLLIIVGLIALVFLIYIITVMAFSANSDVLTANGEALLMDIQAIADEYSVPYELLVATAQLHASYKLEDSSDDLRETDLSKRERRKILRLLRNLAKQLTPQTNTETFEVTTSAYTKYCPDTCYNSQTVTKKSKETVTTSVISWDKRVEFEYEVESSGGYKEVNWGYYEVCNNGECYDAMYHDYEKTETLVVRNESEELDYSKFESILKAAPYNYSDEDIKFIELLYLAMEKDISYSAWKEGASFNISIGGHDGSVIPGTSIPSDFFPLYREAEKKFGVGWNYLAAIHSIETKFSTMDPMISYAHAEGHMQFMRCTWHGWGYKGCKGTNGHVEMPASDLYNKQIIAKYGGYGLDANNNGIASPWEIEDAIFSAAYYLSANNFAKSPRQAIAKYNKSTKYVNEVMALAKHFADEAQYLDTAEPNQVGFVRATAGTITSPFGMRYIGGKWENHIGVDIANTAGTPIYSVANGTVRAATSSCPKQGYYGSSCGGGWGNYVIVTHNVEGQVYETVYAHLSSVAVKSGQTLQAGQLIGGMGTSGSSTGVHLHLELHKGKRNSGAAAQNTALNPAIYIPM